MGESKPPALHSAPPAPPRASGESTGSSRTQSGRTGQQGPRSRNFEFVLVNDNESRRQVRRHAMRQYMRQRRLDSIARLDTSRIPVRGWTTRSPAGSLPSSSSSRIEDAEDDEIVGEDKDEEGGAKRHPSDEAIGSPSLSLVPSNRAKGKDKSGSSPAIGFTTSDPRASPEAGGKRDPFSAYPIEISHADHELIQHFVVTYPSMMYKFSDSRSHNPMMEIFRQFALRDSLPFQAMLAIASKHRAGVERKGESVQSLTHKMRALRLINERIQSNSTGNEDGTMYAVATMAVIEEKWSKDASIERMHFKGLVSMIRSRGGMRGMRASSFFLEKVLYWVDFACLPKAITSFCLPWTGNIPDTVPDTVGFLSPELHLAIPHHPATVESTEALCDQFRACEDFLRFFRRLHDLETIALNSPSTTKNSSLSPPLTPLSISDTSTSPPPRPKHFAPGTHLHTILTTLPDYDHGIRDVRFIDEYTAMACLLFLNIALYNSYRTATPFTRYITWLESEIHHLNPFSTPSITSLLWLFLNTGGYSPDEPGDRGERCWVVSRMLRIAKRLEWKRHGEIWDRLRNVLVGFVATQQECALGYSSANSDSNSDPLDDAVLMARQVRRSTRQEEGYFWDEQEMRGFILDERVSRLMACSSSSELGGMAAFGVDDLMN